MTWTYAHEKIDQALATAKGNAIVAARVVVTAAQNDARLLNELAAPHLRGIVAHAVAHVIQAQKNATQRKPVAERPAPLDMSLDEFGRELLGALSGRNTPYFGFEDNAPRLPRKAASKAHVELMTKIARKQDD